MSSIWQWVLCTNIFGGMYYLCIEFRPENIWQVLPKCWYVSAKVWGITSLKTTLQLSWIVFDCCVCASHLLVLHCKYTCLKFCCLITSCYGLKHSIWVNIYWKKVVYLFKWTYILVFSFEVSICWCFKVQILSVQSTQFLVKLY